jgi:hypothetical protein
VLISIPRLFTPDVVRTTRNRRLRSVGASVASVTILALALSFFGTGL